MKIDNSPPRGTRDLLPDVVANRDRALGTIAEVYQRYGYERIETPCLEDITRLESGEGGENEKLIFRVLRRGLPEVVEAKTAVAGMADLGLRFDLTVRSHASTATTTPDCGCPSVPSRWARYGVPSDRKRSLPPVHTMRHRPHR